MNELDANKYAKCCTAGGPAGPKWGENDDDGPPAQLQTPDPECSGGARSASICICINDDPPISNCFVDHVSSHYH